MSGKCPIRNPLETSTQVSEGTLGPFLLYSPVWTVKDSVPVSRFILLVQLTSGLRKNKILGKRIA